MSILADQTRWLQHEALARFVADQTCAALQDEGAVRVAMAALNDVGLPVHPDAPKNWDTFLAIYHALASSRPSCEVLDAGAERYSAFLPSLRRLGWSRLTGINLAFDSVQTTGGITFEPGDITSTRFPAATFGYIACLSVIEHGVNVGAFLSEMARILRPGGRLFVSFDYWESPIHTHGITAYDAPVRVFDRDALHDMVQHAEDRGFVLHSPARPGCTDRVVHWRRVGLRYTFANLLFRRM